MSRCLRSPDFRGDIFMCGIQQYRRHHLIMIIKMEIVDVIRKECAPLT